MPSAQRRPLNAAAIERDFRRLADDPAIRTVDAQLRPGAAPGEASLHLEIVPRDRFDLYFTAGNNRSPSVGGERLAAGGAARNLAASGDLLSGELGVTRGVLDASLAYAAPVLTPRTFLTLRGSFNRAAVVDRPLAPLDIRSRDRGAEASLVHRLVDAPLMPVGEGRWAPSRQLSAGIGVAWRRQRSFLLGEPFSFAPGSVDGRSEYGAARLIGDYVQRNVDQVFALSATASIGLDGTRSDQPGVPTPDRHFLSLLVQANYARRLAPNGLELRGRLTGQAANGVLYSAERLSIGGEASVRGYRETLILADQGLVGSVELALPFSLSGANAAARNFDWGAFTIAAFADAGTARNVGTPDPDPRTLASVGLSLAWQPSDAVSAQVAYGLALIDVDQTGSRDLQDRGLHFRFTVYPLRFGGP
jgi:hemolysin activation/secretion protein